MKKTKIIIYPSQHSLRQRWTVIWANLTGKPYHHTITHHNVWKLVDNLSTSQE